MALQSFTEDGHMQWQCTHCQQDQAAHISHPEVTHTSKSVVALPACSCGSQTFLKVDFTEKELAASNMIDRETGQPTESHAVAHRHIALAKKMAAVGKGAQR